MNKLHNKIFNLLKHSRIQQLPFRACVSTLQVKSVEDRNGLRSNLSCRSRILSVSPLIQQQCRLIEQDVSSSINTNITPLEVPGKGKLVYLGTMAPRIKLLKMFSISTSLAACLLMPGVLGDLSGVHILGKIAVGFTAGFFVFLSPFLVHQFSKRYVTWIYYDESTNQFTATTYSFLARGIDHVFRPEDVDHYSHGLLSSIKVNNVPLAIDASLFLDRIMYSKLMGFDKEEWKLPDEYYQDKQERARNDGKENTK